MIDPHPTPSTHHWVVYSADSMCVLSGWTSARSACTDVHSGVVMLSDLKPRLHDTTCCQTGCETGCDNRVNVWIHDTTGCETVCQLGCTTRFDNRLYRVNGVLGTRVIATLKGVYCWRPAVVDLSVVLYRVVQAKNENQSCIDYKIKSQVNLIYGLEAPCTRGVPKGA